MKAIRRIIIVGGVAGGASAAARARRVDESAEIHVFERGPYISFANCGLPYHIAGEIQDRSKLLIMTPEKIWTRSRVHAHVNHEVLSIDRSRKIVRVRRDDGVEKDVSYDKLILSQGAKPIVPSIPGADLPNVFTLRDVPDMDRIIAFLEQHQPKTAAIIGGGFIGLEMAEAFGRRGMRVTVIEKLPQILPLLDNDVALHLQNSVRSDDFAIVAGAEAKSFNHHGVELAHGAFIPAELILLGESRRRGFRVSGERPSTFSYWLSTTYLDPSNLSIRASSISGHRTDCHALLDWNEPFEDDSRGWSSTATARNSSVDHSRCGVIVADPQRMDSALTDIAHLNDGTSLCDSFYWPVW